MEKDELREQLMSNAAALTEAFFIELFKIFDSGHSKTHEPQLVGHANRDRIKIVRGHSDQLRWRKHISAFLPCNDLTVIFAKCTPDENSEYQAAFMELGGGNSKIFFWFGTDGDPNDITAQEVVSALRRKPDLAGTLAHEYTHFLQDYSGFDNIVRNVAMCVWSYEQLSWEVEAHCMELSKAIAGYQKQGKLSEFGISGADLSSEERYVQAAVDGKFDRVLPSFKKFRKANAGKRVLTDSLRKGYGFIRR